MINAQACGVRGDIAVEKGNYEAAVAEFKSALAKSADKSTFIYFNHKLARLYAKMDKGQEAMGCYNAIDEKYPNEGFEAEL
jgi:predicted negative regulator of RcsB-dependent stress response